MEKFTKKDFELLEKLGEGTFGEVHQGRHRKTGKLVALKRVFVRRVKDGLPARLIREINSLKQIDDEHVVQFYGSFPQGTSVVLILELLKTDLWQVLQDCRTQGLELSEAAIKGIMQQVFRALAACHRRRILHRDIKPSNFLLAADGAIKLADFGQARVMDPPSLASTFPPTAAASAIGDGGGSSNACEGSGSSWAAVAAKRGRAQGREAGAAAGGLYSSDVATRWYRAPELLFGSRRYGPGVDVWAAGVLLAELCAGGGAAVAGRERHRSVLPGP